MELKNQRLTIGATSFKKEVLVLIVTGMLFRWIAAGVTELGNDEAYYWLYSQYMQWNYFDHPPMVAVWIRLFTFNLLFHHEAFIRLGSVAGCALATWFMYKTAATIHSEKAGWYTACLFNSSFYVSVTAGIYMLPDSPQIVFWTWSLWMIARLMDDEKSWRNWLLLGIATGFCMLSKVHGMFIWSGLILFMLLQKRKWLNYPQFYCSVLITIIIASPILIWNIQHDFINYRFHSNRVSLFSTDWNMKYFLMQLIGQITFNNPVNVLLIVWASFRSVNKKPTAVIAFQLIAWPLVLLLILMSLTRETFPHWSGPAYVTLTPLAGIALANKIRISWFPKVIRLGIIVMVLVVTSGIMLINHYPGTWGSRAAEHLGKGDNTLDMFGWKEAGNKFAAWYRQGIKAGSIKAGTPMVCLFWSGAHVEFYFGRPAGMYMIGLGPVNLIHQYFWTNQQRSNHVMLNDAFCIIPSDQAWPALQNFYAYYQNIYLVKSFEIVRNNKPVHDFLVYRLHGFKGY